MKAHITPVRSTAPKTIEELTQDAYSVYAKRLLRLGCLETELETEWAELSGAEKKAWISAVSEVAAYVTFCGCPRPMDLAGDVCEASRCAEWLLHIADGGDAGSEAQLHTLMRTAAGLLVRPITPLAQQPGAADYSCCNSWFISLPEGRQAVLRDDKWMLAHAAFEAGRAARADVPAAAVSAPQPQPAPKTFDELPLATCVPSTEERAKWINVLDPLLKYAGRPGDWGSESKLGLLTQRLMQVRQELAQGEIQEGSSV